MTSNRLYTLDGMRGVAAICVALYHLNKFGVALVPGGSLAVDFFFALSGIVITVVYEPRLRRGHVSLAGFARQRFIRFWPLYAIGAALGLICLSLSLPLPEVRGVSNIQFGTSGMVARHGALALLMLPDPWSGGVLYPANPPAWSLFFEFLVNMAFAAWLIRLGYCGLAIVWGMALLLFVASVKYYAQFNVGFEWATLLGGIARVTCSFVVGVILARIYSERPRRASWWALLAPIFLVAAMILPLPLKLDLAIVAGGIPALIWLAYRIELPTSAMWVCEKLGDVSYPLYATHLPVFYLVDWALRRAGLSGVAEVPIFLAVAIALALVLIRVDARIRSVLSFRFRVRFSARPQAR